MSLNGWPDVQAHKDGETLFIEFKAQGKNPKPLQSVRHMQLQYQGFEILVIDNVNDPRIDEICSITQK